MHMEPHELHGFEDLLPQQIIRLEEQERLQESQPSNPASPSALPLLSSPQYADSILGVWCTKCHLSIHSNAPGVHTHPFGPEPLCFMCADNGILTPRDESIPSDQFMRRLDDESDANAIEEQNHQPHAAPGHLLASPRATDAQAEPCMQSVANAEQAHGLPDFVAAFQPTPAAAAAVVAGSGLVDVATYAAHAAAAPTSSSNVASTASIRNKSINSAMFVYTAAADDACGMSSSLISTKPSRWRYPIWSVMSFMVAHWKELQAIFTQIEHGTSSAPARERIRVLADAWASNVAFLPSEVTNNPQHASLAPAGQASSTATAMPAVTVAVASPLGYPLPLFAHQQLQFLMPHAQYMQMQWIPMLQMQLAPTQAWPVQPQPLTQLERVQQREAAAAIDHDCN